MRVLFFILDDVHRVCPTRRLSAEAMSWIQRGGWWINFRRRVTRSPFHPTRLSKVIFHTVLKNCFFGDLSWFWCVYECGD